MSVGREVYQAGVEPAANSEAISEYTEAEFVRAAATTEEGRAVWRTWRTERLRKSSQYIKVNSSINSTTLTYRKMRFQGFVSSQPQVRPWHQRRERQLRESCTAF